MTRVLSFLLCLASLVILAQLWVLMIISNWIIVDSYAVMEFPKVHPVLGFFTELAWMFWGFGGRYMLAFLALVVVILLVQSLRKKKADEKHA